MSSRMLLALTVVNLMLLLGIATQIISPVFGQSDRAVLRGRALEIVDEQGRVRASLNVLPAGQGPNGEPNRETVLLRLITERGRPSVKIAASEQSAGLSLTGPTGTKETYVILEAKDTTTTLRLRDEQGRERSVTP